MGGLGSGKNPEPLAGRFWEYVNKNGAMPSAVAVAAYPEIAGTQCWEWTAVKDADGYGSIGVGERRTGRAHRVAWFLETGEYPEPQGCHKCDNRACVRYLHLFEGSNKANHTDKKAKGRAPRGSKSNTAKLNTKQVIEIRKRAKTGEYPLSLAHEFGVSLSAMRHVLKNRSWKHV